jgi:DNA-binding NarL/FixJ family response regulator
MQHNVFMETHVTLARALVVENDTFSRTALINALHAHNIEVVGSAANASGALQIANSHEVDVAVLDLDLGPGPSGVDIAHALRQSFPEIGIVFLTSFKDPRLAAANLPPLPQGSGYVTKGELEDFSRLVREILASANRPLVNRLRSNGKTRTPLTDTQVDVLRLVAHGFSTSEIAMRRGVTEKAVEQTLTRLRDSLELPKDKTVNQRAALVRAYYLYAGKLI